MTDHGADTRASQRPRTGSGSLRGSKNDPLLGRVLGGKLRLDRMLGAGASGAVYQAHHLALDKTVAIKVLHAMHGAEPELARRFAAEARAAARFDHANSVQILDFGEDGDDRLLYIAMEFIAGEDLQALLTRSGPLSSWRVAVIMAQVASALAVAHEQGIVHRDLKPSNIMLVPDTGDDGRPFDRVKVCDFGLAKILDVKPDDDSQGPLTKAGVIFGTPAYMAPEQAQGEPVDHRVDIYAAGVIMFRMVTGEPLFSADSATGVLMKQIIELPRRTRDVMPTCDPRLAGLVDACLLKDPDQRPSSMRQVLAALREIAEEPTESHGSISRAAMPMVQGAGSVRRSSGYGSSGRRASDGRSSGHGASDGRPSGHGSSGHGSFGPSSSGHGSFGPSSSGRTAATPGANLETPAMLASTNATPRFANLAGLVLGSVALLAVGGLFAYVLLRPPSAPTPKAPVAPASVSAAPGAGPRAQPAASSAVGESADQSARNRPGDLSAGAGQRSANPAAEQPSPRAGMASAASKRPSRPSAAPPTTKSSRRAPGGSAASKRATAARRRPGGITSAASASGARPLADAPGSGSSAGSVKSAGSGSSGAVKSTAGSAGSSAGSAKSAGSGSSAGPDDSRKSPAGVERVAPKPSSPGADSDAKSPSPPSTASRTSATGSPSAPPRKTEENPARLRTGFQLALKVSRVEVSGGLSVRKVTGAIERRLGDLKPCVRDAVARRGVVGDGRLQVTATIGFSGKLEGLRVAQDSPALKGCVKDTFARARMPKPDTGQAELRFYVAYLARN